MSGGSYTFRDAQLRSTPLRALNWVGRRLSVVGLNPPPLTLDSIVSAAQKRAGEEDLGSDSFVELLARYLEAAREEAELNTLGRLALRGMLVSSLATRIRLASWAKANVEVRSEVITQPWVILGLPRTGTSLLSILLGLDPASRALMHWEGANPVPPPTLATAAEEWLGKACHAIESGMSFDKQAKDGWCEHILYADLIDDPIATVRRIYRRYDEEVSPLHERRMKVWMRSRTPETTGRHVYDPGDFGWSYDALADRFREYRDRYSVPRE